MRGVTILTCLGGLARVGGRLTLQIHHHVFIWNARTASVALCTPLCHVTADNHVMVYCLPVC